MARGIMQLLRDQSAELFATAIPRTAAKPQEPTLHDFLRKDHVFLLERYFYFLEEQRQYGLLVMDEIQK